jgi:hypothetical protein
MNYGETPAKVVKMLRCLLADALRRTSDDCDGHLFDCLLLFVTTVRG